MAASSRSIPAALAAACLAVTPIPAASLFLAAPALILATPAWAQRAIEGLADANKLLREGDPARALEKVMAVFNTEKLDNDTTAKAMLLRAEIYEKLGKPALAYADYNAAVWLGGLTAAERSRASEGSQRTQAAQNGAPQTPAQGSRSGSGSFLSTLFGGGSSADSKTTTEQLPPGPAQTPAASQYAPAAGQQAPSAGHASRSIHPGGAAQAPKTAGKTAAGEGAATPSRKPAADDGKESYAQFASFPNEAKALGEARRLAQKLSGALSDRSVLVIKTEAGGKAQFRIVSGPLSGKAEAGALCKSVKAKGVGCAVYTP